MEMLALCESVFYVTLLLTYSALCMPMQSAFEANAQKGDLPDVRFRYSVKWLDYVFDNPNLNLCCFIFLDK